MGIGVLSSCSISKLSPFWQQHSDTRQTMRAEINVMQAINFLHRSLLSTSNGNGARTCWTCPRSRISGFGSSCRWNFCKKNKNCLSSERTLFLDSKPSSPSRFQWKIKFPISSCTTAEENLVIKRLWVRIPSGSGLFLLSSFSITQPLNSLLEEVQH